MEELLNQLLKEAITIQATDLHFMTRNNPMIYIRHKGKLKEFKKLSLNIYQSLMTYMVYKANINLNESQKMQTGSLSYVYQNTTYYLRLSYMPGIDDLHLVLRILNHERKITLSMLTTNQPIQQTFKSILQKESGMIILCGPTGCGKSTTLHAFIDYIQQSLFKNIITVEDPIEIHQENLIQIEINEDKKLYFEDVLKQILRHDPDIIMLGEMRDEHSAKIALRLALTGHLVLTTLHSKNVKQALNRLYNLNIDKESCLECINAIISQRLIYSEQKNDPSVYFELATKKDIQELILKNKQSYPSLQDYLLEDVSKGVLNEKDIQAYIDD